MSVLSKLVRSLIVVVKEHGIKIVYKAMFEAIRTVKAEAKKEIEKTVEEQTNKLLTENGTPTG